MSTTYQQQPSANQLKQEKSHSQPPSACHLITLQHLASPIQPNLPTRPTVCLPFVISSLLKTKNTSKFSSFSTLLITVLKVKRQLVSKGCSFFNYLKSVWSFTFPDFHYRHSSGMSWGSEQIYEVTQIRTLLNPSLDIKSFFFLFFLGGVWLVLADRSLVTWQDLLPVTSRLFLLLAPNSLCAPRFKQWTSFIQMVASECGFLHLWPVHSSALDHHIRFL